MLRRTSPGYCYYYYYHYHDNRTLHHWVSFPVLVHFVQQRCAGWEREFPQDSVLKELLSWSLFIWQEIQERESRATGESFEALPRHEMSFLQPQAPLFSALFSRQPLAFWDWLSPAQMRLRCASGTTQTSQCPAGHWGALRASRQAPENSSPKPPVLPEGGNGNSSVRKQQP